MAETIPVVHRKNLPLVTKHEDERDLNDIFDSITCLESKSLDEGYRQGLEEGQLETSINGFVIGINTGSNISLDLGYCQAFCTSVLQAAPKHYPNNSHLVELCKQVIEKVQSFPRKNVETEDMIAKAAEIKSQLDKIKFILNKQSNDNTIVTPPSTTTTTVPQQTYSF